MVYLATFGLIFMVNLGRYTIVTWIRHGFGGRVGMKGYPSIPMIVYCWQAFLVNYWDLFGSKGSKRIQQTLTTILSPAGCFCFFVHLSFNQELYLLYIYIFPCSERAREGVHNLIPIAHA